MMYVRMIGVMLINLYASRLMLQILGVTDYGIYTVVGGFVTIFSFIDVSISNAAQRYMSIGLGKGQQEITRHYFRQSFTILITMAVLMIAVAEPVGTWYVKSKLVIPTERLTAALWVFHLSVVSVACSVIRIIFLANIIAREDMGVFAYTSIFEAVSKWLALYLLLIIGKDKLIWYAFFVLMTSLVCIAIYAIYCKIHYPECSFRLVYDKKLVKEMSSFIGLTAFGGFSHTLAHQGINLILNFFFGPVANAARGIAVQAASFVGKLNTSVSVPVRPALIKAYAEENLEYVENLIHKSSKFTFYLVSVISFTLIAEIDYVLLLWLGQSPPCTANFCRLAILDQLVLVLVSPLSSAANATGRIKNFELYGRMITLASLPISYLFLVYCPNPYTPFIVLIVCNTAYWLFCLRDIIRQLNFCLKNYFKSVMIPCGFILLITLLASVGIAYISSCPHIINCLLILLTNSLLGGLILFIFSSTDERIYYKRIVFKIYKIVKK